MFKHALLLLPLACLSAGAAHAADDPLIGAWKLNPQKSALVDEMKVASLGANTYSFDFGGIPEKIVLDGTDQPGIFGTTLAVTVQDSNDWIVVRKKDGHPMLRALWTLSPDGTTLHDNYTELGDNGQPTMHVDYIYNRKEPGTGFAADWLSTNNQFSGPAYVIEVHPWEGDGISIVSGPQEASKNVKFDGKDYPDPGSKRGVVSSARRVNEKTIQLTDKIGGKILDTRDIAVSDDGRTLTMTLHLPARSEPDVLVFDRQ